MTTTAHPLPPINLLVPGNWSDYELLDSGAGASGAGAKLERFGPYRFVRPEGGAIWPRALPEREWAAADGVFATADEEGAGRWEFRRPVDARWAMRYGELRFWAQPTPFRHLGVFPEQASQWDWMSGLIRGAQRPVKVLNLFGYTGLATLAAAAAGASVTHVDASQKAMAWARENQALSGLADRPIRWLIDDALKFVRREVRREARYDGLIIDPPKFGRGPKGELWKLEESLPELLDACRSLFSAQPRFVVLTVYAIRASAVGLQYLLEPVVAGHGGAIEVGEMGVAERGAGRVLSSAIYARWSE
jgi:23S rRNA (cytosine1962-C5)-methyltransferase